MMGNIYISSWICVGLSIYLALQHVDIILLGGGWSGSKICDDGEEEGTVCASGTLTDEDTIYTLSDEEMGDVNGEEDDDYDQRTASSSEVDDMAGHHDPPQHALNEYCRDHFTKKQRSQKLPTPPFYVKSKCVSTQRNQKAAPSKDSASTKPRSHNQPSSSTRRPSTSQKQQNRQTSPKERRARSRSQSKSRSRSSRRVLQQESLGEDSRHISIHDIMKPREVPEKTTLGDFLEKILQQPEEKKDSLLQSWAQSSSSSDQDGTSKKLANTLYMPPDPIGYETPPKRRTLSPETVRREVGDDFNLIIV